MTLIWMDSFENIGKHPEVVPNDWWENTPGFICAIGENSVEIIGEFKKWKIPVVIKIIDGIVNVYTEKRNEMEKDKYKNGGK